jgi:serine phosphatase RsbU (regulator of sigma subunit)
LTFANAGHLPPYWNGNEIEMEASLPLGVAPAISYAETTIQLAPGDQITILSDGVVEAANSRKELFGFDRTRKLTTKSAAEIAAAAKSWGQNDDITVLTVRRTA